MSRVSQLPVRWKTTIRFYSFIQFT